MGLIKEPVEVDFTIISKVWTAEEEKEFSEFIRKQKKAHEKKQMRFFVNVSRSPYRPVITEL
jgi:hypothetical protein